MTDDLNNRDAQADSGAADHGKAEAKPEDAINWKAKAEGYSGEAIKQRNLAAARLEQVNALTSQVTELEVERDARTQNLTGKLTEAEKRANQHQAEAETLRREREVGKRIRKEFSSLIDLFDDGLLNLNQADDAALTDYLTKMEARVSGLADKRIQDKTSGSTPPPPDKGSASKAGQTREELNDEMQSTLKTHGFGSAQYQAAYDKYLAFISKPGAK